MRACPHRALDESRGGMDRACRQPLDHRSMSCTGFHVLTRGETDIRGPSARRNSGWPFRCYRFVLCIGSSVFAAPLLMSAARVFADDGGMSQSSARILAPSIPRTVSTPPLEISALWLFVLAITAAILLGELLAVGVVRFRSRPGDPVALRAHPTVVGGGKAPIAHAEVERKIA